MHQTKTGRWVPDKPPAPQEPTELESVQSLCRDAIAAGVSMPPEWPVIHFWARVGKLALEERDGQQQ